MESEEEGRVEDKPQRYLGDELNSSKLSCQPSLSIPAINLSGSISLTCRSSGELVPFDSLGFKKKLFSVY